MGAAGVAPVGEAAGLGPARSRFDAWAKGRVKEVDALRQGLAKAEAEAGGRLDTLQRELEELGKRGAAAEEVEQRHREEEEGVRATAAEDARRIEELTPQVAALKSAVAKRQAGLQASEGDLEESSAARQQRLGALQQAVRLYRDRLGLAFHSSPPEAIKEELTIELTQVDRGEPERTFSFAVHVGADNRYSVTRCEPALEGIGALVQKLNTSNDFAAFVRAMREAFQRGLAVGAF